MPDRMRLGTALPQFRCNDRPEMIHPASDCLVRNCNFALREQVLDVAKAEGEPEIEPDRLVNDLRWEPTGDHSPSDLALSPVHPQLSRRRGLARGARNCNFVRDSPTLGESFRADHCSGIAEAPSQ